MTSITANVPLLGGCYSLTFEKDCFVSVDPSTKTSPLTLGPTLFDIQVNGYGGRTCRLQTDDDRDTLAFITRVFRELGIETPPEQRALGSAPNSLGSSPRDALSRRVLGSLQREPCTRDVLEERLGTAPGLLSVALTELELAGLVAMDRDGRLRVLI